MPQAVHFNLFLHADNLGLTFQHKDVHTIEHKLNKDFVNLWFVDKKLSIYLAEDLFGSKQKLKNSGKLNTESK